VRLLIYRSQSRIVNGAGEWHLGKEDLRKGQVKRQEVEHKTILPCELPCRNKLGKSIVAARSLEKGHMLQLVDLAIKVSEPSGLTAEAYLDLVGKELAGNIGEDEPIHGSSIIT